MHKQDYVFFFTLMVFGFNLPMAAGELSRSFEFRYYTGNPAANGDTDFKGDTAVFDTDQRVEFLKHYAEYAAGFFKDPDLDTQAATDRQVHEAMSKLKPQPEPKIRKRIALNGWRWLGYRPVEEEQPCRLLTAWRQNDGVAVEQGQLVFTGPVVRLEQAFTRQDWRFTVHWKMKCDQPVLPMRLQLAGEQNQAVAVEVGIDEQGQFYYRSDEDNHPIFNIEAGRWYEVKLEVDLAEKGYNVYVDGERHAYFVGWVEQQAAAVSRIVIEGRPGFEVDDLWMMGYRLQDVEQTPYTIDLLINEKFETCPDISRWQELSYDDRSWSVCDLPKVHGGLREAGEDLYLRKVIKLGDFERAVLTAETIDPEGAIWVNGEVVFVARDRHPVKVDISQYLRRNEENVLAVRVRHFINPEIGLGGHAPSDPYIGWFAGRMHLDLTTSDFIDDVFVYTETVGPPARLRADVTLANTGKKDRFQGELELNVYPWYPKEDNRPVATARRKVVVTEWDRQVFELNLDVPKPCLWTSETPTLYKVEAILIKADGQVIDDEAATTGIRTVGQEGGTFRVNGQPAMLNGAQIMGFRAPLEDISKQHRCAPVEWLVREILQIKNMNGNLMRVHVHAWENNPPAHSINDPRLAEIGDQLGIMFMWPTTAWVRTGSPWGVDFEGYPKYIRQVRNHPSIVLWEASNHPGNESAYERTTEDWNRFFEKIVTAILSADTSRLIAPVAKVEVNERTGERSPIYPHPLVVDGSMDVITGYGRNWERLRQWPDPAKPSDFDRRAALASPDRAYFNFEHQESIGQPNWNLAKGKPWYLLQSYEWKYDVGSVGRQLTADEWPISQAWQAFSAYEAIRKMRWLDYDGFSWCCLHGGSNNVTYKKPLIDFLGYAKLSYWANKMAFQNLLAGSNDVDVVYGPDDVIRPIVMNLGEQRTVSLEIEVKDIHGQVVDSRSYPNITVSGGRTVTPLDMFQPQFPAEGCYAVEYVVR